MNIVSITEGFGDIEINDPVYTSWADESIVEKIYSLYEDAPDSDEVDEWWSEHGFEVSELDEREGFWTKRNLVHQFSDDRYYWKDLYLSENVVSIDTGTGDEYYRLIMSVDSDPEYDRYSAGLFPVDQSGHVIDYGESLGSGYIDNGNWDDLLNELRDKAQSKLQEMEHEKWADYLGERMADSYADGSAWELSNAVDDEIEFDYYSTDEDAIARDEMNLYVDVNDGEFSGESRMYDSGRYVDSFGDVWYGDDAEFVGYSEDGLEDHESIHVPSIDDWRKDVDEKLKSSLALSATSFDQASCEESLQKALDATNDMFWTNYDDAWYAGSLHEHDDDNRFEYDYIGAISTSPIATPSGRVWRIDTYVESHVEHCGYDVISDEPLRNSESTGPHVRLIPYELKEGVWQPNYESALQWDADDTGCYIEVDLQDERVEINVDEFECYSDDSPRETLNDLIQYAYDGEFDNQVQMCSDKDVKRMFVGSINPDQVEQAKYSLKVGVPFDLGNKNMANVYVQDFEVMDDKLHPGKKMLCLDASRDYTFDVTVGADAKAALGDTIKQDFGPRANPELVRVRASLSAEEFKQHVDAGRANQRSYSREQMESKAMSSVKEGKEDVVEEQLG